ncbi:MAG: hypothetical protein JWP69_571 [Flaviaesturariibacter sp.]|nr:hypothetical protein [Flaviaesturariibacter sp.]
MPKHYFNRLERLDYLIRVKGTGAPKALADKIGVSERTLYDYIEILKSLGASISYCRCRESYYYETIGYFNFHFVTDTSYLEASN